MILHSGRSRVCGCVEPVRDPGNQNACSHCGGRVAIETQDLMSAMTNEGLLKAYASLTHRLHAVRKDDILEARLRGQRDVVETEILSRMEAGHVRPV